MGSSQFNQINSATLRGLANNPYLHIFDEDIYFQQQRRVYNFHLKKPDKSGSFASLRGRIDAIALREQLSNADLHQEMAPQSLIGQWLFDCFEQLRVESICDTTYKGMRSNIEANFTRWSHQCHADGFLEQHIGVLLYSVIQIVYARLNARAVIEETEGIIEETRSSIAPLIGIALSKMLANRHDQRLYAKCALTIIQIIEEMVYQERNMRKNEKDKDSINNALLNWLDVNAFDAKIERPNPKSSLQKSVSLLDSAYPNYKIFTTLYDFEKPIEEIARPLALKTLRDELEQLIIANPINVIHLAQRLKSLFLKPEVPLMHDRYDSGYIDGAQLVQIALAKASDNAFLQPITQPEVHASLCVLIDCSGSIRPHNRWLAGFVETIIRACNIANIKTEVIGFTTNTWQGGNALKLWEQQGKPNNPGRLNERLLIQFKSYEQSYTSRKTHMAGLLKDNIYKESIDGESLDWACKRLIKQEGQRCLIILSDSYPSDTCTRLQNQDDILSKHLQQVIQRFTPLLPILGVGIGEALPWYYHHQLSYDINKKVNNSSFNTLIASLQKLLKQYS